MASVVLFAGGEDIDFSPPQGYKSGTSSGSSGTPIGIGTAAGTFRAGFARCCLAVTWENNGNPVPLPIPPGLFSAGTFWLSFYVYNSVAAGTDVGLDMIPVEFFSADGLPRLRIVYTSSALSFQTINTAGVATTIGGGFTASTLVVGALTKVDVFVNYSTSGSVAVYFNNVPVFSYTGDITASSGLTALDSKITLGAWGSAGLASGFYGYSEVIVSTQDTRSMSLWTLAPVANGNANTWTISAVGSVDAIETLYTASNSASAAGQIDEYEVTPAAPSGSFVVVTVVQKAALTAGTSGPVNAEFMQRVGGVDYTSSSVTPPAGAWQTYAFNWDLNPSTTLAWQTSNFVASSSAYNIGVKSA